MSKLNLVWGLAKTLLPEPIVALIYAGRLPELDGRRIDPKAQAASDLVKAIRGVGSMPTVAASRRQMETLAVKFDHPRPSDVLVRDIELPGADGPRAARVYVPGGGDPMAAQPTLFFLHGGGWVQCSIATHDALCGKIAKQAGVRVVSYDYRLAPEHKFPAAADDVLTCYRALVSGKTVLGIDPTRLAVGGDSAGANLAAVLLHDLAEAGEDMPAAQVLVYPATDGSLSSNSMMALANQPFLPRTRVEWFRDHYLPDGQDPSVPRVSPLNAPNLAGQPPALLIMGGHDPLWDDAISYADRLEAAGVAVTRLPYPGQIHGFLSLTKAIPQGSDAIEKLSVWLKNTLEV